MKRHAIWAWFVLIKALYIRYTIGRIEFCWIESCILYECKQFNWIYSIVVFLELIASHMEIGMISVNMQLKLISFQNKYSRPVARNAS